MTLRAMDSENFNDRDRCRAAAAAAASAWPRRRVGRGHVAGRVRRGTAGWYFKFRVRIELVGRGQGGPGRRKLVGLCRAVTDSEPTKTCWPPPVRRRLRPVIVTVRPVTVTVARRARRPRPPVPGPRAGGPMPPSQALRLAFKSRSRARSPGAWSRRLSAVGNHRLSEMGTQNKLQLIYSSVQLRCQWPVH